jgi:hypothetical protein
MMIPRFTFGQTEQRCLQSFLRRLAERAIADVKLFGEPKVELLLLRRHSSGAHTTDGIDRAIWIVAMDKSGQAARLR